MTDPTDFGGEKGMDAATGVVNVAVHQVDRVGQHLNQKLEAAKRPETWLTMLADVKPMSADYLFGKVDAMPMRRDKMKRAR